MEEVETKHCDLCDKTFKSKGRLDRHLKSKRHIFKKECDLQLTKKIKINNYKEKAKLAKRTNKENGTYRCDLCDHNYGSNSDLRKHTNTKRHLNKIPSLDVDLTCTSDGQEESNFRITN